MLSFLIIISVNFKFFSYIDDEKKLTDMVEELVAINRKGFKDEATIGPAIPSLARLLPDIMRPLFR